MFITLLQVAHRLQHTHTLGRVPKTDLNMKTWSLSKSWIISDTTHRENCFLELCRIRPAGNSASSCSSFSSSFLLKFSSKVCASHSYLWNFGFLHHGVEIQKKWLPGPHAHIINKTDDEKLKKQTKKPQRSNNWSSPISHWTHTQWNKRPFFSPPSRNRVNAHFFFL